MNNNIEKYDKIIQNKAVQHNRNERRKVKFERFKQEINMINSIKMININVNCDLEKDHQAQFRIEWKRADEAHDNQWETEWN